MTAKQKHKVQKQKSHIDTNTNTDNPTNLDSTSQRLQITKPHSYTNKYQNAFQAKFTSNKLKIMFVNQKGYTDFKAICVKENIEFCLYTIG
ncbi:unnamed protein product [Heterotrigona itama]|uniref:Uncharacterized protein n=1 Tax=Heterotrigona itama TaxID=395501 RepID=A0A6V7HI99_9HYME|nr:unnamed protein product [Heterotrigona itama]